jgi:hypothetical protein
MQLIIEELKSTIPIKKTNMFVIRGRNKQESDIGIINYCSDDGASLEMYTGEGLSIVELEEVLSFMKGLEDKTAT